MSHSFGTMVLSPVRGKLSRGRRNKLGKLRKQLICTNINLSRDVDLFLFEFPNGMINAILMIIPLGTFGAVAILNSTPESYLNTDDSFTTTTPQTKF